MVGVVVVCPLSVDELYFILDIVTVRSLANLTIQIDRSEAGRGLSCSFFSSLCTCLPSPSFLDHYSNGFLCVKDDGFHPIVPNLLSQQEHHPCNGIVHARFMWLSNIFSFLIPPTTLAFFPHLFPKLTNLFDLVLVTHGCVCRGMLHGRYVSMKWWRLGRWGRIFFFFFVLVLDFRFCIVFRLCGLVWKMFEVGRREWCLFLGDF